MPIELIEPKEPERVITLKEFSDHYAGRLSKLQRYVNPTDSTSVVLDRSPASFLVNGYIVEAYQIDAKNSEGILLSSTFPCYYGDIALSEVAEVHAALCAFEQLIA